MDDFDIPKIIPKQVSSINKFRILVIILTLTTLAGTATSGWLFYQYKLKAKLSQSVKGASTTISKNDQDEVKKVVSEVGKLMVLPNEEPTLATVADIDKLKDQPFFKNAKNGDKLLIYGNAKKVILYDPVAKKIVDAGPVNISSSSAQQAPAKIALRNGTATPGLAAKLEAEIKKNFPDANIITRDNANKDDYDKTIVVPLNEGARNAALNLAKALNVSVADLPPTEKPTGADILLIIGKDKAF